MTHRMYCLLYFMLSSSENVFSTSFESLGRLFTNNFETVAIEHTEHSITFRNINFRHSGEMPKTDNFRVRFTAFAILLSFANKDTVLGLKNGKK